MTNMSLTLLLLEVFSHREFTLSGLSRMDIVGSLMVTKGYGNFHNFLYEVCRKYLEMFHITDTVSKEAKSACIVLCKLLNSSHDYKWGSKEESRINEYGLSGVLDK